MLGEFESHCYTARLEQVSYHPNSFGESQSAMQKDTPSTFAWRPKVMVSFAVPFPGTQYHVSIHFFRTQLS